VRETVGFEVKMLKNGKKQKNTWRRLMDNKDQTSDASIRAGSLPIQPLSFPLPYHSLSISIYKHPSKEGVLKEPHPQPKKIAAS